MPDEPEVEVLLLGSVQARRRGQPVHLVGSKQRTLLAALALEANRVVSDQRLIDLLWPEEPPDTAVSALRVHISKLRHAIEPAREGGERLLVRRASGYQLTLPEADIDLARCRHLIAEARRAADRDDTVGALQLLDQAAALWRGDPLAEFGDRPFAVGERSHLEQLRLETFEQRFDVCLRLGLHGEIAGELEELARRYPLRERLQGLLILALYRCGRQADASGVYHRTRLLLSEDLGMDPGPELQALFRDILKQSPAAATPIERPRVPRSDATSVHNLPARLSSFIGRDGDVAELTALLARTRMLTLVGPGGIGKTSLAVRLAQSMLDRYPDGVWFADLVPVTEPGRVHQTLLAAAGLRQLPDLSIAESLRALLGDRRSLLVIDNCEHLIDAVAEVAQLLLETCPELTVLATSRERTGLIGEQVWPVPSLSVPPEGDAPSLDQLRAFSAIRLFADRARMVRPSFELDHTNAHAVTEICRRLDGLPLAIELAAARVSGLRVDEIVARLGDRFRLLEGAARGTVSRHRTIRETLDWSSALLAPEERRLFERLGVFAGTFDLNAIEAVCADELLPQRAIAPVMSRLVDKSLVVFEPANVAEGRYRLLETVREYVRERLAGATGEALRRRHAQHYFHQGRSYELLYFESKADEARRRYTADYANARSALAWSFDADPAMCLDLVGPWRFHWWLEGLITEGSEWLQRALALPGDNPAARARALSGLGRLTAIRGDREAATEYFREGLALAETAGDDVAIAELTNSLGVVYTGIDNDQAEAHIRRAAALWEQLGYTEGTASAYGNLAQLLFYANRFDEARQRFLQEVEIGRAYSRYNGLVNLSHLERHLGNYAAARERAAEALPLAAPLYAATVVEAFAFLAAAENQGVRAAVLSAAALRLFALRGAQPDPGAERERAEQQLRDVIGRLDGERLAEARRRGTEMSLDAVFEYALRVTD